MSRPWLYAPPNEAELTWDALEYIIVHSPIGGPRPIVPHGIRDSGWPAVLGALLGAAMVPKSGGLVPRLLVWLCTPDQERTRTSVDLNSAADRGFPVVLVVSSARRCAENE